jgi:phosphoglycolate phosphatase-like HAD superfamily hydrolase
MLLDRAPGAVAQGSIYIGDSPKDVQMAKSLGFLSIGVAWCRHVEKDALEAAHPDLIFDDPRELFKFLVEKVRAL